MKSDFLPYFGKKTHKSIQPHLPPFDSLKIHSQLLGSSVVHSTKSLPRDSPNQPHSHAPPIHTIAALCLSRNSHISRAKSSHRQANQLFLGESSSHRRRRRFYFRCLRRVVQTFGFVKAPKSGPNRDQSLWSLRIVRLWVPPEGTVWSESFWLWEGIFAREWGVKRSAWGESSFSRSRSPVSCGGALKLRLDLCGGIWE